MHPVIEHILSRKGKTVPVDDGRKIALFLSEGLMTGIRGAGAVIALSELGLSHTFDDIYAVSAGFPNACYFLTDNTRLGTSIYYEDLCSKKFINLARTWDIVNIDYVLQAMREVKPLDYKGVSGSPTRLHVGTLRLPDEMLEYHSVKGKSPEEIERIIKATISIPYLNLGSVAIGDNKYKDAGMLPSGELLVPVLDSDATDILIIYNNALQMQQAEKAGILDSERVYQITPYEEEKLSRLCTDSTTLKSAAQSMGDLVKSIFGSDEPIRL